MIPMPRSALLALLLATCPGLHAAVDELTVPGISDPSFVVPVSIEGLTGEAASVVRFDLEVAGFDIVSPDKAMLRISGTAGATIVGRVTDRAGNVLLRNEYTGGTIRSQAHTFSDHIVELLPGRKGIARSRIAFRVESGGISEIYVADYDGHNAIAVTQDRTINRDPVWVPGRRALYYTSYRTGNPHLYLHDLASGSRQLISGFSGLNAAAALSPDGRRLAMVLSKDGSPDVYVANADGSNLRRLTKTREDESSPVWSPDGQTICFASRLSGRAQLYLISADGGPMRLLQTTGAVSTTEPDWSPDGTTIAFTALMGGFQICTVPATGGRATILTPGEDASWAANSRTLIFTRRAGGQRFLSLLDVPTKRVKDIRQLSGSSSQAVWAR
jgi:TolB protein